jgi:hypothetical protein
MFISELIDELNKLKSEHGDVKCLFATRYVHFEVKRIGFSAFDDILGDHICIRLSDDT